MQLSLRLKAIAEEIPVSRCVADIGTDHGYIPVFLVQQGVTQRAVAADISRGSLRKAESLVRQHRLESVIEIRLGGGLTVLSPREADTILLAGMGGLLIRDILAERPDVARSSRLVLQPMAAQDVLRKWLSEHEYRIEHENLVREAHRFYEIMTVTSGCDPVQCPVYYTVGKRLIEQRHPLLEAFVLHKIQALEEILKQLEKGDTQAAAERHAVLKTQLRRLEEVYRWEIKSKMSST